MSSFILLRFEIFRRSDDVGFGLRTLSNIPQGKQREFLTCCEVIDFFCSGCAVVQFCGEVLDVGEPYTFYLTLDWPASSQNTIFSKKPWPKEGLSRWTMLFASNLLKRRKFMKNLHSQEMWRFAWFNFDSHNRIRLSTRDWYCLVSFIANGSFQSCL